MSTATRAVPWSGYAVAISSDRVLLGPEAAVEVLRLIAGAERVARRDGIRSLPPQLLALRAVMRAVSADGHADVREEVDLSTSDQITTQEVATMLGCSERHARRLAAAEAFGTARQVGRGWLVDRDAAAAFLAMRNTAQEVS